MDTRNYTASKTVKTESITTNANNGSALPEIRNLKMHTLHNETNLAEVTLTVEQVVQISDQTRHRIAEMVEAREFPPPLCKQGPTRFAAESVYQWLVARENLNAVNRRWWTGVHWDFVELRKQVEGVMSAPVSPETRSLETFREMYWDAEKRHLKALEEARDTLYGEWSVGSALLDAQEACGFDYGDNALARFAKIVAALPKNDELPVQTTEESEDQCDRGGNGDE